MNLAFHFIFIFFLLNLFLCFLIIRFVLLGYIGRRLKIIYKLINTSGKNQSLEQANTRTDIPIFDMAERDVENWLTQKNDEQIALVKLEEYRREYIGNVSHELKTPIFNLQGYLQALVEGGINDEEVNLNFLRKAISNADRLQTIVDDLETISRLESGKQEGEFEAIDLKELSLVVFEDLASKAQVNAIKLIFKSEENHPVIALANREQIRIVLSNLIQNAIKYGRMDGFVKIRVYEVDSKILVEVADNGIGIPEEGISKVFERFYRIDKSRARDLGGSGLGLSIVKHIIEYHNQTIHVRSVIGEGTVFSFTLERAKIY
ncbi:MAG: ATP-binding protein [Saprospiraceae bacterium]